MFTFILNKIRKKLILNISLFVGVVFLTGFLCVYPMFRDGSLDRLLLTMFEDYIESEKEFPTAITFSDEIETSTDSPSAELFAEMVQNEEKCVKELDGSVVMVQKVLHKKVGSVKTSYSDKTKVISLACIPDLEKYADIVDESSEEILLDESKNIFPCYISERVMDQFGFVTGEALQYKKNAYSEDDGITFKIAGVVEEKIDDSYFWFKRLDEYSDALLVTPEVYDAILRANGENSSEYDEVILFDYTKINHKNANKYADILKELLVDDSRVTTNFYTTLKYYENQKKSIEVILFSSELPIVALLFLFLYMISSRILQMETTEISMLRSRGIKRGNIILLYIRQSEIIAILGVLMGIPCGYIFCQIAASATAFLEFGKEKSAIYGFTLSTIGFAIFAFVSSVVFMAVPVIKLSKMTITERVTKKTKQRRKSNAPLWERYFLDLIIMLLTGYLGYNYYKQRNSISLDMLMGNSVDPIIFLNSFAFMFGCGLLLMRLSGYIVSGIYKIGKNHWRVAPYVALLQIIRGTKGQGFITVFLVMTIAMGVFNINIARTMNENMQSRTEYDQAADLKLSEKWKLKTVKLMDTGSYIWSYHEPDFARYDKLSELGVVSKTKVIIDNNTDFVIDNKIEKGNTLMAIHTKEFGETAELDGNLNDKHWFYYLNELAKNPTGVLISSNLAKKYELKVGDKLKYERYSPIDNEKTYVQVNATICGIIDAFPGFETYSYHTNENGGVEEKENYLVVANYAIVVNKCKQTPYQIYFKLRDDADVNLIRDKLSELGIELSSFSSMKEETQKNQESAMVVISNGMFSLGFIISLLIFCLGFLIYWILTIRERQLQYGIYRAMGVSMGEIVSMLVLEQIFCSVLSALSGFVVGIVATRFFIGVIALVYFPRKHNLPIAIINRVSDVGEIAIILSIAFIICFVIMSRDIKKMDITKALKMGDN